MIQPAGKRSSYQGACLPAGQRDFRYLLRAARLAQEETVAILPTWNRQVNADFWIC